MAVLERVKRLEDPISALHPEVQEVSKAIYEAMKGEDDPHVWFVTDFYERFSKPLAVLEARNLIKGQHAVGQRYYDGIRILDPSFVMYMSALCADDAQMNQLMNRVESCERGKWLHGQELQSELELPMPVISACFEIFEANGYGLCSRELGPPKYVGKA